MSASAPPPPPDPRHSHHLKSGCSSSPCRPAVRRAKTVANPESQWRREPLTDVTNEVLGRGANPVQTERRLQVSSSGELGGAWRGRGRREGRGGGRCLGGRAGQDHLPASESKDQSPSPSPPLPRSTCPFYPFAVLESSIVAYLSRTQTNSRPLLLSASPFLPPSTPPIQPPPPPLPPHPPLPRLPTRSCASAAPKPSLPPPPPPSPPPSLPPPFVVARLVPNSLRRVEAPSCA